MLLNHEIDPINNKQTKRFLALNTNLRSDSNKSFSSCVELFFKWNHNALKMLSGFINNVPCNLKKQH